MTLIIRSLETKDLDAADALIAEIHNLHCAARPDFFSAVEDPLRDRAYWHSLLDDPNVGLFLAIEDDTPAGLIHLVLRETQMPMLTPRRFVVVDTLIVGEAFRQRGIGRKLMRRAEQWAIEHNADNIELNVFDFNQPAIALYAEMGYEVLSRRMSKKV